MKTSTYEQELQRMNAEIVALQRKRMLWIEENYLHFAKFQVGDRIYAKVAANDYKLEYAGIVTRVYVKAKLTDDVVRVYYEFERAEDYHYSPNTEGGWAYYRTHAEAVVERQQTEADDRRKLGF